MNTSDLYTPSRIYHARVMLSQGDCGNLSCSTCILDPRHGIHRCTYDMPTNVSYVLEFLRSCPEDILMEAIL